MKTVCTEVDFERMNWHDCSIWGLALHAGDPDDGDWTSELVLDIDFIVEWAPCCGIWDFLVAPASLVFKDVTEPKIQIEWPDTGFAVSLNAVSIASIERERIVNQRVCLDRPYYVWRIQLNSPEGLISFGATGFTQTLCCDPVQNGPRQSLSWRQRECMRKG
jgi:hypothetical protein